MQKLIMFSIISLILIVIFLWFYPFPNKIDIVHPVVSFNYKDPSSLKNTSVHVSGTLYRPLFRQHVFKGSILIKDIEKTENQETLNTDVLERKSGINMGNLVYKDSSKKPPNDVTMLGVIWFDDHFENISILGTGMEQNPKEVIYIVTGESYKQALSTLKKMRDDYGPGFLQF